MTSFYHYDGQLSTRQLTDGSQTVTDTYTYDAFGNLLNRSGATENDYLYTGEQYDPNIGFYYLRARYYNQTSGRFLTMDTYQGSVFEPASLHKYLYCGADPVGNWDPSGNETAMSLSAKLAWSVIIFSTLFLINSIANYFESGEGVDWQDYFLGLGLAVVGGASAYHITLLQSAKIMLAANIIMGAVLGCGEYLSSSEEIIVYGIVETTVTRSVAHGVKSGNLEFEEDFLWDISMGGLLESLDRILQNFYLKIKDAVGNSKEAWDKLINYFMSGVSKGSQKKAYDIYPWKTKESDWNNNE